MTPRRRGLLLAAGAFGLMAFAQYNLAGTGSCSTPPEDGLPACPDLVLLHLAAFGGGIAAGVVSSRATNPGVSFAAVAGGFGAGSLSLAIARGDLLGAAGWLGAGALALAAVALAAGVRGLARAAEDDRLMAGEGVFADGTVLAVTPTGVVEDGAPVVRVRMRIEPFGMLPPYEAEQSAALAEPPLPGERCAVWVRPGDPSRWVFRRDEPAAVAGAPGASDDVVVDMAALNAARRAGRIDAAEFARLADLALGSA